MPRSYFLARADRLGPGTRLGLLVFAVVGVAGQLGVGMRATTTASITADEPFYMATVQSLVSDGDLDLRDEYADGQREIERFWDGSVRLWKQMEPAPDGRLLAPHDPGLPLLAAVPYAVGGLRGVQRTLAVVWAVAMALAAVVAVRLGAPRWAAGVAAVAVGAGAPGVVYASQVYPEGPAAACVAGLLLVVTGRRARPVVVTLLLVALAWLGVKYAFVGALLFIAWAWKAGFGVNNSRNPLGIDSKSRVVPVVVALAVAGVHYAWWHLETFGSLTPYSTNVVWAGEGTRAILVDHLDLTGRTYRLYGLFIDARFGLFRWLPVAVLGVLGLRRRTWLPAAVVGVGVLVGTFLSITMMGWWFPGRMLVAGLPALVVLVAFGVARLPRVGVALAAWSLAIGAAVVWSARTGGIRLAVDPFDLGFPLAPHWLFPDFRQFALPEIAASLAWAAVLATLATLALLPTLSRGPRSAGATRQSSDVTVSA